MKVVKWILGIISLIILILMLCLRFGACNSFIASASTYPYGNSYNSSIWSDWINTEEIRNDTSIDEMFIWSDSGEEMEMFIELTENGIGLPSSTKFNSNWSWSIDIYYLNNEKQIQYYTNFYSGNPDYLNQLEYPTLPIDNYFSIENNMLQFENTSGTQYIVSNFYSQNVIDGLLDSLGFVYASVPTNLPNMDFTAYTFKLNIIDPTGNTYLLNQISNDNSNVTDENVQLGGFVDKSDENGIELSLQNYYSYNKVSSENMDKYHSISVSSKAYNVVNDFYLTGGGDYLLTNTMPSQPTTTLPLYSASWKFYTNKYFSPRFDVYVVQLPSLTGYNLTPRLNQIFGNYSNYTTYFTLFLETSKPYLLSKDSEETGEKPFYLNTIGIVLPGETFERMAGGSYYAGLTGLDALTILSNIPTDVVSNETLIEQGRIQGFNQGYQQALEDAYKGVNRESLSFTTGYQEGRAQGYTEGLKANLEGNSPIDKGFISFIGSLASIFNIPILGDIRIADILTIIASFTLLGLVIKLIRG